jgi:hypothetical protein
VAEPDPVDLGPRDWRGAENAALLDWSTWVRVAGGLTSERPELPPALVARAANLAPAQLHNSVQGAVGVDLSLPIGRTRVRVGPWLELRGFDAFVGGELVVTGAPGHLDLFLFDGEGALTVRGGGGADAATASVAWGYRAPWNLHGPFDRTSRYQLGVRLVATATRAYHDSSDWSATLGLELEPIGALRYLLGIRSWY